MSDARRRRNLRGGFREVGFNAVGPGPERGGSDRKVTDGYQRQRPSTFHVEIEEA
jgi:hypothetical protein